MNKVDAGRDRATPAGGREEGLWKLEQVNEVYAERRKRRRRQEEAPVSIDDATINVAVICVTSMRLIRACECLSSVLWPRERVLCPEGGRFCWGGKSERVGTAPEGRNRVLQQLQLLRPEPPELAPPKHVFYPQNTLFIHFRKNANTTYDQKFRTRCMCSLLQYLIQSCWRGVHLC